MRRHDGDGDGDGYGVGSGCYGGGYGGGYGYGYGGVGSGYGSGYGVGCYGYGSGDGYGSSGYGSSGYGDGDGYFDLWLDVLIGPRAADLRKQGAVIAFWLSNYDGTPANGGRGVPRRVGMVEKIEGPLRICTSQALHATLAPWKWKGDKLWAVALYPPVEQENDKLGSLQREILAEIPMFFK